MRNDSVKTLGALHSLILKDLECASEAQLRAEMLEDGEDPDAVDREIAESLDGAVAEFLRNRVAATKAVKMATSVPIPKVRPSLESIRLLVQRAFDVEPNLAAAYRKGTKQSNNDWISVYDDLVLLGKIDPDDHGN